MANGLQDFLTVREDTDVRTRRGTDDSMMNYDIDMPSIAAIESGLPFQEMPDIIKPERSSAPQMPPDPFSVDAFDPVDISMDASDFSMDASDFSMDASDFEPPTIENKIENLKLDEGGIDPVSAFASVVLGGDGERSLGGQLESSQQPELSEQEQEDAVKLALLHKEMPLDFLDPAVQAHFAKFGIDLEQYMIDREARKEGGTPFINAGLALSRASQEGMNVPQAITAALATFSATKEKLNELDPMMLQIAMAMLPKPGKAGALKSFHILEGPLSGEIQLSDEEARTYLLTNGPQSLVGSDQISDIEKDTKQYRVPVKKSNGDVVMDLVTLNSGQVEPTIARLQAEGLLPEDVNTLEEFNNASLGQWLDVFDNELGRETQVTENDVRNDEVQASIDADYDRKYRVVGGTKLPATNQRTGETGFFSPETLSNPEFQNQGWKADSDKGTIIYGDDGNVIATIGNADGQKVDDYITGFQEQIENRGQTANKMITTLQQVEQMANVLSAGGDISGGQFSREFFRLKDVLVGGTAEVISAIGADPRTKFVLGDQEVDASAHREDFLSKLNGNSVFQKILKLEQAKYTNDEARRQAASALEGTFYSLALQIAMGPYNMTARSISDKDMDRTLQLIGASAATFPAAILSLTSEIERSMISDNNSWVQSQLITSPDITVFKDDPDNPGQTIRETVPLLVQRGHYIPDPDNPGGYMLGSRYTNSDVAGFGAVNKLNEVNSRLKEQYTALSGTNDPGNRRTINPSVNIPKTLLALEDGKTYSLPENEIVQFNRDQLDTEFANNVISLDDSTIQGKVVKTALTQANLGDTATFGQLLGVFSTFIAPKLNKETGEELETLFFQAFPMTPDQQNMFKNYFLMTQRHGTK